MDEYRYATYAVKKRWELDVYFFEAGHEQVKPVWLDGSLDELGAEVWLKKLDKDAMFGKKLIQEMLDIIRLEQKVARSVPNKDLSPKELEKHLFKHLQYWVKYFAVGFLWFATEPIRIDTNKEIEKLWKGTKEELQNFLDSVYRPMKFPPSSIEQRELLALVPLKGKALDQTLARHTKKYRHLSLHNIDDEFFNEEYYRNRVKNFQESQKEYKDMLETITSADQEAKQATEMIKKSKLPFWIKNRINFVRWFMYIRTASIDYMMMVNGAYKPVISSMAKLFDLPVDGVLHMTFEEMVSSVRRRKLPVPRRQIMDRTQNGYAYLIAPHGSYLVTGKEIDDLRSLVVPEENKEEVKSIQGQTAFKGKATGVARVIIDRRNASELKPGEILVTTMTSPEFVPAMKISAGIITNEGGILCHAAIMSRELRKPCVIGTKIATDIIKTGQRITLDADKGMVTWANKEALKFLVK